MNWQVKYALANIAEQHGLIGEKVDGELIRIVSPNRPDVLAAISGAQEIDAATAADYRGKYPDMDFLCGYRSACLWHGDAITYLQSAGVGWGNSGTLTSAALDGDANVASHKIYRFSDRLLRQYGPVREVIREFDRVHRVILRNGHRLRIAMLADYEPTANAVRSLWDQIGPVDIVWNINPNGGPSPEAIDAGLELGCRVMKWDELRECLRTA